MGEAGLESAPTGRRANGAACAARRRGAPSDKELSKREDDALMRDVGRALGRRRAEPRGVAGSIVNEARGKGACHAGEIQIVVAHKE